MDAHIDTNKKIHEWLGAGCWHSPGLVQMPKGFVGRRWACIRCSEPVGDGYDEPKPNPDFTSWDGMRLLLEGVRQKGYAGDIRFDSVNWTVKLWTAFTLVAHQRLEATADTLPLALTQATLKLIEQEEKDAD